MATLTLFKPAKQGTEAEKINVSSLDELLNLQALKVFQGNCDSKHPYFEILKQKSFKCFSKSKKEYTNFNGKRIIENILMAEFDNGNFWYVVGNVDEFIFLKKLPDFNPNEID